LNCQRLELDLLISDFAHFTNAEVALLCGRQGSHDRPGAANSRVHWGRGHRSGKAGRAELRRIVGILGGWLE
jgi:hypothetical protein